MIPSTFSQKTVWQVEVIHVVLSAEVSKLSHSVIKKTYWHVIHQYHTSWHNVLNKFKKNQFIQFYNKYFHLSQNVDHAIGKNFW